MEETFSALRAFSFRCVCSSLAPPTDRPLSQWLSLSSHICSSCSSDLVLRCEAAVSVWASTCGPWRRRCRAAAARAGCGRRSCRVWASEPPWGRHDGGGRRGCYRGASLGWRASFLQAASAHRHWGSTTHSQLTACGLCWSPQFFWWWSFLEPQNQPEAFVSHALVADAGWTRSVVI